MSKLGDFVKVQGGYAFKSSELSDDKIGVPVIKIGNITGGSFVDLSNYQSVSFQLFEKTKSFATKDNDILIAMTGANVGKTSRVPVNSDTYLINQRVGRFLLKDDCPYTSDFIYYVVSSKQAYQYFSRVADGAAQPNISGKTIEDFEFPNLDSRYANKIGDILKSLDDKIQLNSQINQTLEQIAQTIFKSWFIDFDPVHAKAEALANGQTAEQATQAAMAVISGKNTQELHRLQTANPEQYQQLWEIAEAFPSGFDEEGVPRGWEERELSYLFEFLSGAQPPKSEHIYEEKEGYERFIQNRDYSNDNHKTYIPISKKNKRCTEKDILMDKYGEAGKVRYGIKGAYNVALAKIVPQKDNLREFLRSYFTQDKIRNYLSSSSMASTRNSLNSTTFTRMKVIVPNDFLLSTFDKLANEKIDKILQIKQENIELSKLRDYLLPKLLSGEV
ncbi:restriction endonuclease subunit S [Glaesserella parasuis]|uniref:restriction endonuclease subunit S n=1 Tax=Glaesserella parasuis TaxID=738 RepID=UPI002437401E|nr:restriction endonuclease subunit S [Glaesserella parasuis]MDG6469679.1 restriction endonuclease subunit S [Glaesserella parasuis]